MVCLLYLIRILVWHLLPGWSGKLTGPSEEVWELSDKYCPCILLNIFIYRDCQKMIWKWVMNPDQEVRLFTARHPVSTTREHSQNWCLEDVITLTLHQPENGGILLLSDDRIKHTLYCENQKHHHCLDNPLCAIMLQLDYWNICISSIYQTWKRIFKYSYTNCISQLMIPQNWWGIGEKNAGCLTDSFNTKQLHIITLLL